MAKSSSIANFWLVSVLLLGLALVVPGAQAEPRYGTNTSPADQPAFGTLARTLGVFEDAYGLCDIDPAAYETLLDRCIAQGGRPWHCSELARRAACRPRVVSPPDRPGSGGVNPFADMINRGDMKVFDPTLAGQTQGCIGPKPRDIGCTTLCKPCITFVCSDGEWKSDRIDFPDDICEPRGGGGGPSSTACPRTDTGFCPAECSVCF